MSLVISSISQIVNVVATPTARGTLAPNTTYYIRITAHNFNDTSQIPYYALSSPPSTEVSFTTTVTNLSASVTWDVPTITNPITGYSTIRTYDIYITTTSGDYLNNSSGSFNTHHIPAAIPTQTSHTSTTNSRIITTYPPTNGYSYDTFTANPAVCPFMSGINKNNGLITFYTTGTETFTSIYNAINTAFPGNAATDGYRTFAFLGGYETPATITGSVTETYKRVLYYGGFFRNLSTANTFSFTNCEFEWASYSTAYSTGNTTHTGCIFKYGSLPEFFPLWTLDGFINVTDITTTNCINGLFHNISNYRTNFSGQTVYTPGNRFRAWFSGQILNADINCYYMDRFHTQSTGLSIRDTRLILNANFTITGDSGSTVNDTPTNIYDVDFEKEYDLLTVNFVNYIGTNSNFDIHNSYNFSITDENGDPIDGAAIEIYNDADELVTSGSTDVTGILKKDILVYRFFPTTYNNKTPGATLERDYGEFRYTISKTGYETYQTPLLPLREKKFESITMKSVIPVRKTDGGVVVATEPESGSSSQLVEV